MPGLYNEKRTHTSPDQRIATVAAAQYGVFSRAQARRCGATDEVIRWRLKVGRWDRLHPSVYRLAGTTTTWRQHAMAACLHWGPGATLSHRAAVFVRGLSGYTRARVEITVPRNRRRSRSRRILIHWLQDPIPEEDITIIDSIPVTKPARTLLDLATVEPEEVVERCLDDALRRRLVSLPFLESWLEDPRRSRHRGARVLQRLVAARATVGVTESPLEAAVLKLIRDAGLPIPTLQYEVRNGDRFVARVDFAYPDERVAIEADGFRFHDDRRGFDEERARGNELEAMGWRVLRVTSRHVEEDPEGVTAWVHRALSAGAHG